MLIILYMVPYVAIYGIIYGREWYHIWPYVVPYVAIWVIIIWWKKSKVAPWRTGPSMLPTSQTLRMIYDYIHTLFMCAIALYNT